MAKFRTMRDNNGLRGLLDLVDHIQKSIPTREADMVEIGSYTGESTVLFAKKFKSVLSIDPFVDNYDPNDRTCNFAPFDDVYRRFMDRISEYKNVSHLRETSDEACKSLAGRKFGVVYIDGMHTYEQVLKDISNYRPLVLTGGFICGHDFASGHPGVRRAVAESLGKPDIVFRDSSWVKMLK